MAASTKAELLETTAREYEKLATLLARTDECLAMSKDDDDTSIKDVVGHRAHWIELYLGWYRDGKAGRDVAFPAPGYKWSELKRYNAGVRAAQADLGWNDALDLLATRHDVLIAFIEGRSEDELYGGPMQGAKNDWTAGRWAEAAGSSHYRSAAKYVRSRTRNG